MQLLILLTTVSTILVASSPVDTLDYFISKRKCYCNAAYGLGVFFKISQNIKSLPAKMKLRIEDSKKSLSNSQSNLCTPRFKITKAFFVKVVNDFMTFQKLRQVYFHAANQYQQALLKTEVHILENFRKCIKK